MSWSSGRLRVRVCKIPCVCASPMLLRLLGILFLLVTCSAQQCVQIKLALTAGICKDNMMNRFTCTNTATLRATADQISEAMTIEVNKLDQATCQSQALFGQTCDILGGIINPDFCKVGGNMCKTFSFPECKTDPQCGTGVEPFMCCQALRNRVSLMCTGVNTTSLDTYITRMKTQVASNMGCRDTDCVAWSSASSLRSAPIDLQVPALALLVVLVFCFS
jgi:hypothetical protein